MFACRLSVFAASPVFHYAGDADATEPPPRFLQMPFRYFLVDLHAADIFSISVFTSVLPSGFHASHFHFLRFRLVFFVTPVYAAVSSIFAFQDLFLLFALPAFGLSSYFR
jgi:hypothetical protein